jgi:hypothetical protein
VNRIFNISLFVFFIIFESSFASSYSLIKGQFDREEETESDETFAARVTIHEMLENANKKAKSERKSVNTDFDANEEEDDPSELDSAELLIVKSKKCSNHAFNRFFEIEDESLPLAYQSAYVSTISSVVEINPELRIYEYFPWISVAQEYLKTSDMATGASFALIKDGDGNKIAACKFALDPSDLTGARESHEPREIKTEFACSSLYHALGFKYFINNALLGSSLIEEYFDSALYSLSPTDENSTSSARGSKKTKEKGSYVRLIKNLREFQDKRAKERVAERKFFDKTIVSLEDLNKFFKDSDEHRKDLDLFYDYLDPENITELFAMWYVGYQRDMHGSNIMVKFTNSRIHLYGFDFEHSLRENYASFGASSILHVRTPEFLKIGIVQRMPLCSSVIEKLQEANTDKLKALLASHIPEFSTSRKDELVKFGVRLNRLATVTTKMSRLNNLLKLYEWLIGPDLHPYPKSLTSKKQAWQTLKGDSWPNISQSK